MQKLHLVGFTTDQAGLILSVRRGARSGSYTLAVDDVLSQAVEDLRARQAELAAAGDGASGVESRLPVSEIQARLRRGKKLNEIAKEAGVEPAWVERFAAPVFSEMAGVISRVQSTYLKRARLGPSGVAVGEAVRRNLVQRGVAMAPADYDRAWSTHQRADGRWIVKFGFTYRGSRRTLKYEARASGDVVAADPFTSQLSYVAPPKRARPRPKPAAASNTEPKRAAVVGSGFRAEDPPRKKKATSRPAKEREKAAAAMSKAASRRAADAERAAARKARERAQALARSERESRAEAQRRDRESKARAREAAASARLAAAERAERERREEAEAVERRAERERARATRKSAAKRSTTKKPAVKKATAKKSAVKKSAVKKSAVKKAVAKRPVAGKAAPETAAPAKPTPETADAGPGSDRVEAARKVVARARAERARRDATASRPQAPDPDERVAAPPPRALFREGLAQPATDASPAPKPASPPENGQGARPRPAGFRRRRPLRAD